MSNLIVWIIIGLTALVLDIATSSFLFVWFTLGSIGAIVVQMLQGSVLLQIVVFLAISGIFMAVGYPLVKRVIKGSVKKLSTMEQNYLGRELILGEKELKNNMIKIDGIYWTYKNEGEELKPGDKIIITGIQGNRVVIRKSYV